MKMQPNFSPREAAWKALLKPIAPRSVPLVGDRDGVGTRPAHASGGGRGAAVRGGDVGGVPVVVGEHAAADWIDEDRLVLQAHLGAALGHELVHDAVPAQ